MKEEPAEFPKGKQGSFSSKTKMAGFALAAGDIDIFKLLYEYRFLRREQISARTGLAGDSLVEYPKTHSNYSAVLDHIGPIEPGDEVPVLPFPPSP